MQKQRSVSPMARVRFFSATLLDVRRWIGSLPRALLLLLWTVVILLPILAVLSVAFKTRLELLENPVGWPQIFHWSNFTDAWNQANLGSAFLNSSIIGISSVVGIVLIGASAAYPLARRIGKGYNTLYLYFFAGIILPTQFGLFALYNEWTQLGLVNNLLGVILCEIGGAMPFVVFLYTGFIKGVSPELEEAAALDGAGPFRTFWTIVFPLLTPATATIIITTGLSVWNDLFTPLVFLQDQTKQTLPLALYSFVGQYGNNWTLLLAAVIIASLPVIVVFLFLQRYFVQGLSGGALKG